MTYKTLGQRAVLAVEGADSASFLQNLLTADVTGLRPGHLAFSCLLSPQGQLLYQLFLFADASGYFIDAAKKDIDPLLKKLKTYALRAKVSFREVPDLRVAVGAGDLPGEIPLLCATDPRLGRLGLRAYGLFSFEEGGADYEDLCVSVGIAPDSALQSGRDYMTDLNLDLLGAVSWEKGCFVGQEVAARMHHRGLVKKRLLCLEGEDMAVGDRIFLDGMEMGEVRAVDKTGRKAVGLLKLSVLGQQAVNLQILEKTPVKTYKPSYLLGKN